MGVVVSGTERCLHTANPWDSLGYQAIEEAVVLFDNGDCQAATSVLAAAFSRVERPDLRSELAALQEICGAYFAWDLFDHAKALTGLEKVLKQANNLRHAIVQAEQALDTVRQHIEFLGQIKAGVPCRCVILDLMANARRCGSRGRYDDGVARLYRTIEATAQVSLMERLALKATGAIPLAALPPGLRGKWSARARGGDTLRLGLRDDYELLSDLGSTGVATRFGRLGLAEGKGPLESRNNSILAHGFEPVRKSIFEDMWKCALDLAGVVVADLPEFPRLGGRISHP